MVGHSLGRMEACFGPSIQGAGIRYQNTSQIQILRHFDKNGRDVRMSDWRARAVSRGTRLIYLTPYKT